MTAYLSPEIVVSNRYAIPLSLGLKQEIKRHPEMNVNNVTPVACLRCRGSLEAFCRNEGDASKTLGAGGKFCVIRLGASSRRC